MAGSNDVHDINDTTRYILYRYHPSLAAAAVFVVLFGLSTALHIYQTIRKRSWFLVPFIIGGLFETIGYIGRIQSSHDQWKLGPYVMQTLLLLLAPAFFAASIYMTLGRIILLTDGEKFAPIRRTWLTKIFVGGDVVMILMQGAGGGIMSSGKSNVKTVQLGENVIVGGLFIQLVFFGLFVVTTLFFEIRGRAHLAALPKDIQWRKYLVLLYVTSTAILIRSVFRVIEYLQGNAGYLLRHEVFLYIFDGVLMLTVMVVMNAVHPGDIARLLREKHERGGLTMDRPHSGTKESGHSSSQEV